MNHSLLAFAVAAMAVALPSQEIAGVKVSLTAPAIVPANQDVTLRLLLEVQEDAVVPVQMINGVNLTVRVDGEDRNPIQQAGNGEAVSMVKGTRLERVLSFPADQFIGEQGAGEVRLVAVGWSGIVGADCSFKLAPSTADVKLDELDLEKTEVILATNYGNIRLAFRPDKAPNHVKNFVKLALQGFYDGTQFHRVIRNFMVQGGCPNTRDEDKRAMWGTGDPGYKIDAEFNDIRHLRGTLSMARSSDPNSAGSQFFVVHKDSPHLDNQYTAFGNVVEGMDVVDRIANVQVGGPQRSAPVKPVKLEAAIVLPVKK